MRVLAVDQARHGGWAVFDYEKKRPIEYGEFSFESNKFEFEKVLVELSALVCGIAEDKGIDAVFIEDIQMQKNVDSFKKLAQLQGALMLSFEEHQFLYDIIAPSQWQGYCNARGRTSAELKDKKQDIISRGQKASKILSIEFVKEHFGIETQNDNLADSLCIGWYVVNNILLMKGN